MSKEIYFCSEDKKYKCAVELAASCDRFGCPDHSVIILTEERPDGTYVIAEARDRILETEKDKQIADLQHRLEVADKALELSCDCVPCKFCPNGNEDGYCCKTSEIWDSSDDYECNTAKFNHFKEQAEKELKGE